ncbi:CAP-Gly domain-containing linker 1 isoform X1, partial [Brachionus plicatilis]
MLCRLAEFLQGLNLGGTKFSSADTFCRTTFRLIVQNSQCPIKPLFCLDFVKKFKRFDLNFSIVNQSLRLLISLEIDLNFLNMSESSKANAKASSKLVKPSVGIPKPATKQSLNSTSCTSIASNLAKSISTANLNPEESRENPEDFKINDRVWVNGSKAGCIAFIGET